MNTKLTITIIGTALAMSLMANAAMAQVAEPGQPRQEFKGPVKVFILAGQSNMEGLGGIKTLDRLGEHPTHGYLLKKIKKDDGSFIVRDDVFVSYQKADETIKRPLSVGMGGWGADWFGPELMFGIEMGDFYKEPVLLIKTCWGGHSLYGNFRPPSAGKPAYESGYKPEEIGASYHKMVKEVRECLANLDTDFPPLKGLKTEICGFVWFQGWNDMCQPGDKIRKQVYDEYCPNFIHLVQDLRAEFKVPNLPVVLGELGVGGEKADKNMLDFRAAQARIATCPELKGALGYVRTAPFWYPELDELPAKMEAEEHRVRKAVAAQLKEQLKDRPESADPRKMEELVKEAGDKALKEDAAYQKAKMESDRHVCNWYCHYQGSARVYCLVGCSLAGAMKPLLTGGTIMKQPDRASDRLSPAAFVEPPVHVRPGAFWDWLNGSITQEQITRDLEAMKHGGMRGAEIWDVAACADPDKRVPAGPAFLGPESTRLVVHAIREADRLGLEIGIVASSGWNAGGSWVPPEHAGKGLYQSTTTVTGPKEFHANLPLPGLPEHCPQDARGRPVYLREVAVVAVPHDKAKTLVDVSRVVDLTKMVDADGRLRWTVPAGDWDILRFVCMNHGQQLIVPSPNSGGPMIDFFDPRATEFHLNHIVTTILKELGRTSFEGTSFKTLEFDSMELDGFTPWNEIMAAEFQRRVGLPVTRFLPVLAGWKLADKVAEERFRYDWSKFVSDLLIDSHYVTGRKFLEAYGVKLIAESGGPGAPIWSSNPVDGIKALGAVDIPRGEFWNRHRGIFLVKEIASAAHVYDKRLVDAESFTTWRRWVDGPLNHKTLADRALCEGLNCFSLHTFASSPPQAGLPGWAYHAGTDINPSATWWPMARGLMDYLARCSYMLRQGWFVADVCYYYGDQAPNFHPPLCDVPEKPLLDGLDPRHDYDVCSSQVILERMRVENHRIVLPDGMSYAALVLPEQDHIPSEVLAKIHALVADGATVIGRQKPTRAPGMKDQKTENAKMAEQVEGLWGRDEASKQQDQPPVLIRPIDKGRFIIARDRSAALREIGVGPDFEIAGHDEGDLGSLDFIHRKTTGDEFYFIRNKTMEPQTLTCRFRVAAEAKGLAPEFWWPDSGLRSACHNWKSLAGGQTEMPVTLGPSGSVFVVFCKAGAALDPIPRDTFVPAETPVPLALDGSWQVEFPEGWGAPRETTFDKLQSWTESDNDGIRFFSGIATYRKNIEVPESLAKQNRLFLELGNLAEIAEVTLNGRRLGLTWLPPYRMEISGVVKAGANQLEIRVANLWANRLNGDSLLPEAKRFTRSNLDRIQTDPTSDSSYGQVPGGRTRPVYNKIPPLMKSGLFGPVRVVIPENVRPRQETESNDMPTK